MNVTNLSDSELVPDAGHVPPLLDPSLAQRVRVVLVDDDDLFREALRANLACEDFDVTSLGSGRAALDYLGVEPPCDVVLLDWKMPDMAGIDVLREIRAANHHLPVVILTAFSNERNEAMALDFGAVDFLEKSRSPTILAKRLRIIVGTERGLMRFQHEQELLHQGHLQLNLKARRASWRGTRVPLTITEFNIVCRLASRAGEEVSYREIYDVVHGNDFIAGDGDSGYRTNVRSLIKRIRQKFRELDGEFGEIENYAGFGYRWRTARGQGQAGSGGGIERLQSPEGKWVDSPSMIGGYLRRGVRALVKFLRRDEIAEPAGADLPQHDTRSKPEVSPAKTIVASAVRWKPARRRLGGEYVARDLPAFRVG